MKKLLFIILLLLFYPLSVWAACTANDPTDPCTITELNTAIATGNCGNTYYLSSGTHATGINLDAICTEGDELTVSCSDGAVEDLGGCTLTSGGLNFTGDYQILKGLYVNGGNQRIYFDGSNNRLTNNKLRNLGSAGGSGAIEVGLNANNSQNNRIDHNLLLDDTTWTGYMVRINIEHDPSDAMFLGNTGTRIDHNALIGHDYGPQNETMQVGRGATSFAVSSGTIVEDNYFYQCDSDVELISFKSSDNIFRHNKVEDCNGHVTSRGGDNNAFEENVFIQSYGSIYSQVFRFYGDGHKAINNYIETPHKYGFHVRDGNAVQPRPSGTIDSIVKNNGTTTLTDSSESFPTLTGMRLWITQADEDQRYYEITSNTSTTITFTGDAIADGAAQNDTYEVWNNYNPATNFLMLHNTFWMPVDDDSESVVEFSENDDGIYEPNNPTVQNNLIESGSNDGQAALFDLFDATITGQTWIDNIAYATGTIAEWSNGGRPAGVIIDSDPDMTSSTDMYIPQSTGSAHNAGTYDGTNAPQDIYGNTRDLSTPTIGCFEIGGSVPSAIPVGTTWGGDGYTVHGELGAGGSQSVTIGGGSQSVTIGGGSQTISW